MATIDLNYYKVKNSKVFTGRDRGRDIREKSNIDNIINETDEQITISIPAEIMSINPSFLEEFLFNVVEKLGKVKFNEKVKFVSESKRYDIKDDLEEAIDRILRTKNALSR